MRENDLNTEEKILLAAIELFPVKGDMTTREIANLAGVNVAAINYHFKSKDNLMKAVEKHYSSMLYDIQNEIINDPSTTLEDKLIIWANHLMEFMFKWPALITVVSSLILQDKEYNPEIINKFFRDVELKDKIQDIISKITGIEDIDTLNYKYIQLFSGVLGPIIFQVLPMISGMKGIFIDFSLEEERMKYIKNLVTSILDK
ncbi:TetR/AcrR family transcriptional regulator [Tissierella carlieri]|uniref:TetR/AcrR family transcriptional regulator n=1 Tax=Tissierella carlieri TaxID=689904 RepID=A0ABT1SA16_9FIRM|nr:TetR/AcrR family transcriptional regulator [Tissierella carlieri]MCQ4923294.1 TetR/AcrR family transcriptional regulator [Tissierella carlieri]MDU5080691.1 TetR/AcrR family transcriptional regulator [Bacillota bacterium]